MILTDEMKHVISAKKNEWYYDDLFVFKHSMHDKRLNSVF